MIDAVFGLFAKPPVAGAVKTRLVPPLTPDQAAALYGAFLADTAGVLAATGFPWGVFSTDPEAQRARWPAGAAEPGFWRPQEGDGLGPRMRAALRTLLAGGHEAALLVGSDHPTLEPGILARAAEGLAAADLVLGPTDDGGYYLIGVRADHPGLFKDMTWSHPRVFEETVARARVDGLRLRLAQPWYDVDDPADLRHLREELRAVARDLGEDRAPCPFTRAALAALPGL